MLLSYHINKYITFLNYFNILYFYCSAYKKDFENWSINRWKKNVGIGIWFRKNNSWKPSYQIKIFKWSGIICFYFNTSQSAFKNNPFSGLKLEFNLKRPQISIKNNYIYISCENYINCKFNLEIYDEKNEINKNVNQKNNLNSFLQFQDENDDDVILRSSSNRNIDLYILESIYEGGLKIPADRQKIYQIPEGVNGKYKVTSGNSVEVNYYGTITPKNSTMYCYNYGIWACSSWEQPGKPADLIKVDYTIGTSIVTATIDGKDYQITVNVKDYGDEYVEAILNDYIKKNVTNQKTQLDKLKSITAFPA